MPAVSSLDTLSSLIYHGTPLLLEPARGEQIYRSALKTMMIAMKTPSVTTEAADRNWVLVDLAGQPVGRAAAKIASILRGKHKPTFTPHSDTGDFVVVINADKVVLTGTKMQKKKYYRHSNYVGGLTVTTAQKMMETHPERIIESAVRGMLPKTRLGREQLRKFKIYTGPEHPHVAQQPELIEI